MEDFINTILEETFDSVLSSLTNRESQAGFELSSVEQELSSLYAYEDLGWAGRGSVKQAEIEGSILAYQAFIMRHKRKQKAV